MTFDATNPNFLPVEWHRAKDSNVWDKNGKKYIDFTSAIFVANCGHGVVAEAVSTQAHMLIHSYTYPNPAKERFLNKLQEFLPSFCEKAYLACSGSEVTSWALNLMRNYSKKKTILHIAGAFHGKTGGAGKLENEEIKVPFPENAGDWVFIKEMLDNHGNEIAGIMLETYRGYDAQFMHPVVVKSLVEWANKWDVPVCFDEIQAGFYRCGKEFGYMNYGVTPDLICLGKALGGGMPLSALVGRAKYFTYDDMSSTHSGHPVCCAAGYQALKIYQGFDKKRYAENCKRLEEGLLELWRKFGFVIKVNCVGLVAALIFESKEQADKVTIQTQEKGLLLVNTGKKSVKIGPPITIDPALITEGLKILSEVLDGIS